MKDDKSTHVELKDGKAIINGTVPAILKAGEVILNKTTAEGYANRMKLMREAFTTVKLSFDSLDKSTRHGKLIIQYIAEDIQKGLDEAMWKLFDEEKPSGMEVFKNRKNKYTKDMEHLKMQLDMDREILDVIYLNPDLAIQIYKTNPILKDIMNNAVQFGIKHKDKENEVYSS